LLVIGLGLGMVMQVLVIAVQNAVDYGDLGVATSGATLFRLIGGSVGTAVLGAIFAARLAGELGRLVPVGPSGARVSGTAITTQMLASLPPTVRAAYAQGFAASLSTVFLVATGVSLAGFVLSIMLPEHPLRATLAAETGERGGKVGEAFAIPVTPDSLMELRRGLSALANRDTQVRYIQKIVDEAGVNLSPAAAWLLVRLEQQPGIDPAMLGPAHAIDPSLIARAIDELSTRNLIAPIGNGDNGTRRLGVTPAGCEVLGRVVRVRRVHLAVAAAEFGADDENTSALRDIERELVPDARPSTGEHVAFARRHGPP
jgi:DNA-binding MarR family transcriptional regulator